MNRGEDGPGPEDHWRLFIAIEVPEPVREAIARVTAAVARDAVHLRWTDPATWHVTLAFLGAVHPSWADTIEGTLARAAAELEPVELQVGRAGRFGRGVLWLGFDDRTYGAVRAIGQHVREALAAEGIAFDDQALHPHLTIARQDTRQSIGVSRSRIHEVDEAVAPLLPMANWTASSLTLVRSHLGDGPVRHEPLARVRLGA